MKTFSEKVKEIKIFYNGTDRYVTDSWFDKKLMKIENSKNIEQLEDLYDQMVKLRRIELNLI